MAERFVVRFRGAAAAKDMTARLRAQPGLLVLEETPRMVLVEGSEASLLDAVQPGPDVAIVREHHYERPDARPSVVPNADAPDPLKSR